MSYDSVLPGGRDYPSVVPGEAWGRWKLGRPGAVASRSADPYLAATASAAVSRRARLKSVEASFEPLAFDVAATRSFGEVVAEKSGAGRSHPSRVEDQHQRVSGGTWIPAMGCPQLAVSYSHDCISAGQQLRALRARRGSRRFAGGLRRGGLWSIRSCGGTMGAFVPVRHRKPSVVPASL